MSVKLILLPGRCRLKLKAVPEDHQVLVQSGAGEQLWLLTADRRGRDWLLTITSPEGKTWRADGPDLFKALRESRRLMDPVGMRPGVNGARLGVGMHCDMGEGRVVYLLKAGADDAARAGAHSRAGSARARRHR